MKGGTLRPIGVGSVGFCCHPPPPLLWQLRAVPSCDFRRLSINRQTAVLDTVGRRRLIAIAVPCFLLLRTALKDSPKVGGHPVGLGGYLSGSGAD